MERCDIHIGKKIINNDSKLCSKESHEKLTKHLGNQRTEKLIGEILPPALEGPRATKSGCDALMK